MKYYFAPLEGLTDSFYRRLHHKYFPGIDRYYMPFLSPTVHRCLPHKEDRELPMADAADFTAIPQLLTRVPKDFLWAASVCADRGYGEVNLNIGCPSGTVTAKGKGAGMLADPDSLDRFLDRIFSETPIAVSVKTRLGIAEEAEFPALMEIFNRYPIRELTVHPRVRKDFYNAPIRWEGWEYALKHSKAPLCYNGNLNSLEDIRAFSRKYPGVEAVMLGRGLIGDPGMLAPGGTDVKALEAFYAELLEHYIEAFGGPRNAMFRMKENWRYLLRRFENAEKPGKKLQKTTDVEQFRVITGEIFRSCPLAPRLRADW